MMEVAGLVFGVFVVALLIYGIVTHRTRPLEGDAGVFPHMKFPQDWPPLTIVLDPALEEMESYYMTALKEAAAWWEKETGRRYFVPPGELGRGGHIIPVLEDLDDTERAEGAVAYVDVRMDTKTGYLCSAPIYLLVSHRGLHPELMADIFKHELGHCLGLMHDKDPRSIMYHKAGGHGQFVSPKDVDLLEETYPGFAA